MKALFLSLFLISACGDDATQNAKPEDHAQANNGVQYQPDDPKEVVVEYRKDGDTYALAVNDTSELPPCTREFSGRLAWIKSTEQFFSCADESWVEIDVRGAKGETGPIGPVGEKGEPGRPPAPNEWVDPVTEDRWLIGATVNSSVLATSTPCSGDWRLPTSGELTAAIQHGFAIAANALNAGTSFWSSDIYTDPDGLPHRMYVNAAGEVRYFAGVGVAGIACIGGDQ